ncbi:TonB-dependent receptor domain-containing protein [Seohaeicola zhoushanensis]
MPGVTLVNGSTPGGSGINIRGFGANGTFGTDQKVAVQVDGASVGAEELYRIGTQLYTDPFLYRQVSVIRGTVGSFEFGSGIVGGVVKLETKDASDFTGGEIGVVFGQTVEFTSNGNGITSSSILAWQPTENFEMLLNYTWRDQDIQKDGKGAAIGNSAFTLPSGLVKARYTFGQNREHSLTLALSQTQTSDRDVPYDSFVMVADVFGNVDRDTLAHRGADLQLQPRRQRPRRPRRNPVAGRPADRPDLRPRLLAARRHAGLRPDLAPGERRPPLPDHQADGEEHRPCSDRRHPARPANRGRTGPQKRRDADSAPGGTDRRLAFFVVDDMQIGDGWTISPALRYERSRIEGVTAATAGPYESDALMGGLSIRRAFANGFAVFGSAAYTESLPIIDDLGNAALIAMSEKSRTFEIGASFDRADLFRPGDRLAVKANLYSTDLYDVTSYTASVSGPSVPLARVETRGWNWRPPIPPRAATTSTSTPISSRARSSTPPAPPRAGAIRRPTPGV